MAKVVYEAVTNSIDAHLARVEPGQCQVPKKPCSYRDKKTNKGDYRLAVKLQNSDRAMC